MQYGIVEPVSVGFMLFLYELAVLNCYKGSVAPCSLDLIINDPWCCHVLHIVYLKDSLF